LLVVMEQVVVVVAAVVAQEPLVELEHTQYAVVVEMVLPYLLQEHL
jgi:hypothetical protein